MTSGRADPDRSPGLSGHSSVETVRELYDRWAGLYDWNPVLALVRPARRRTVERMALSPGDTVVDMGTGTGANLPVLSEAVGPEGTVIGIDVSPRMLARARARVDDAGLENVTLLEGDIRDPPIDGTVDGILSTFVVVMYADPAELVETWAGYLETGSLANLYAGPSDRAAAPVVNALLGLYLRLFEDGWDMGSDGPSPLAVLARRGRRARHALDGVASSCRHHAHLFGLVRSDVATLRS